MKNSEKSPVLNVGERPKVPYYRNYAQAWTLVEHLIFHIARYMAVKYEDSYFPAINMKSVAITTCPTLFISWSLTVKCICIHSVYFHFHATDLLNPYLKWNWMHLLQNIQIFLFSTFHISFVLSSAQCHFNIWFQAVL